MVKVTEKWPQGQFLLHLQLFWRDLCQKDAFFDQNREKIVTACKWREWLEFKESSISSGFFLQKCNLILLLNTNDDLLPLVSCLKVIFSSSLWWGNKNCHYKYLHFRPFFLLYLLFPAENMDINHKNLWLSERHFIFASHITRTALEIILWLINEFWLQMSQNYAWRLETCHI